MANDKAQKVIAIIADKGALNLDEVTPEKTWNELGFDSLDIVELIMSLESEFSVIISDEDSEKIETVQNAIDYVENH